MEIHQPEPGASDTLVTLLRPLLTPITTTAIIIVFVVFFFFQREDLRNRFIRLAGTGDLERTTTALDDAGLRLSRFFLTQLIVNSVFGVVIGGGLAIIGIPSAPLWGLLAGILRFVPYLGAPLAAISTPLTLCLVVAARHVNGLQFIDIMLGDQPALTPQQATYQRMLAGDPIETIEHAHTLLKDMSVSEYYQEILLGALAHAQDDAERGRLDDKRLENILMTVKEVVEDFADRDNLNRSSKDLAQMAAASEQDGNIVRLRGLEANVICAPGFGRLDQAAAIIVADALNREGVKTRALSADKTPTIDASTDILCLCFLEMLSQPRMVTPYAGSSETSHPMRLWWHCSEQTPRTQPALRPSLITV